VIEAPCAGLAVVSQDEDGNTYFSSWDYGPLRALYDMAPGPCTARVTKDYELDEAFIATLFATDLRDVDPRAVPMGLLLLLAPLSVAASTLFFKQRAAGASSLLLNRDAMWIGASLLGACAFVLEQPLETVWTTRAWLSLLYLSVMASVVTFGVYFWLLRYVPAYRMSLISFVTPLVALLLGTFVGGEPIGPRTVLGALLVLAGIGLAMRR